MPAARPPLPCCCCCCCCCAAAPEPEPGPGPEPPGVPSSSDSSSGRLSSCQASWGARVSTDTSCSMRTGGQAAARLPLGAACVTPPPAPPLPPVPAPRVRAWSSVTATAQVPSRSSLSSTPTLPSLTCPAAAGGGGQGGCQRRLAHRWAGGPLRPPARRSARELVGIQAGREAAPALTYSSCCAYRVATGCSPATSDGLAPKLNASGGAPAEGAPAACGCACAGARGGTGLGWALGAGHCIRARLLCAM